MDSDIDLLALVDGHDPRFSHRKYSIYSYAKIRKMWLDGNPFAWHLFLESRLLFGSDGTDFMKSLNSPGPYKKCVADCEKFFDVFQKAESSLMSNLESKVFDLSAIFLSMRNIATCYSLGVLGKPNFSRHAALSLSNTPLPMPLTPTSYAILERARILCTRSVGKNISDSEVLSIFQDFPRIDFWMNSIVESARQYERIH